MTLAAASRFFFYFQGAKRNAYLSLYPHDPIPACGNYSAIQNVIHVLHDVDVEYANTCKGVSVSRGLESSEMLLALGAGFNAVVSSTRGKICT